MNKNRLLRIANRVHLQLLREFGQGIDCRRMLAEPLYARDVLLVCDALPGSDLASLAQHYRFALTETLDEHGHSSAFGSDSSGFGASRPADGDSAPAALHAAARVAPPWYSPSRWLGR